MTQKIIYKMDAIKVAKICQYALNSVIFVLLVIFCYVHMMEDAIEKSKRRGDFSRGVCSQVLEEYISIAYSKLKLIFKQKKVFHVPYSV